MNSFRPPLVSLSKKKPGRLRYEILDGLARSHAAERDYGHSSRFHNEALQYAPQEEVRRALRNGAWYIAENCGVPREEVGSFTRALKRFNRQPKRKPRSLKTRLKGMKRDSKVVVEGLFWSPDEVMPSSRVGHNPKGISGAPNHGSVIRNLAGLHGPRWESVCQSTDRAQLLLEEHWLSEELSVCGPRVFVTQPFMKDVDAMYFYQPDIIVVWPFEDSDHFVHILLHEVGHRLWYMVLDEEQQELWRCFHDVVAGHASDLKFPSLYAYTSAVESFAETFAYSVFRPEALCEKLDDLLYKTIHANAMVECVHGEAM